MNEDASLEARLIKQILEHSPVTEQPGDSEINTGAFIVGLLQAWPGPVGEMGRRGLEELCRKLAVTNQVKTAYDATWRQATEREDLPPTYWPALIAVLLSSFADAEDHEEYSKGRALKRLNGAYQALDLAREISGVSHIEELSAWADQRLPQVLAL
jgi:hypothetical protein